MFFFIYFSVFFYQIIIFSLSFLSRFRFFHLHLLFYWVSLSSLHHCHHLFFFFLLIISSLFCGSDSSLIMLFKSSFPFYFPHPFHASLPSFPILSCFLWSFSFLHTHDSSDSISYLILLSFVSPSSFSFHSLPSSPSIFLLASSFLSGGRRGEGRQLRGKVGSCWQSCL